jgi:hypothetical protein
MVKSPLFEVIAGSYEEFLLGYNFSSKVILLIIIISSLSMKF